MLSMNELERTLQRHRRLNPKVREMLEDMSGAKPPPLPALPPKENRNEARVEIDKAEYQLLMTVAVLADRFMPLLEQTSAPVARPREYEMLRTRLADLKVVRKKLDAGEGLAALGVAEILRDLQ